MLEQREEREVLLPVNHYAVAIRKQAARRGERAAGQHFVPLAQQFRREVYELVRGTLKPYGRGWDDPADDDLIRQDL